MTLLNDDALHHWLETGNSKPLVDKATLVVVEDSLRIARANLVVSAVQLDQCGRREAAARCRHAILAIDDAGDVL
jgi:hypothetical protein